MLQKLRQPGLIFDDSLKKMDQCTEGYAMRQHESGLKDLNLCRGLMQPCCLWEHLRIREHNLCFNLCAWGTGSSAQNPSKRGFKACNISWKCAGGVQKAQEFSSKGSGHSDHHDRNIILAHWIEVCVSALYVKLESSMRNMEAMGRRTEIACNPGPSCLGQIAICMCI